MAVANGTDGRTVGELVRDVVAGTQTLVTQEIHLARLELQRSMQNAREGAVFLGVAAVFGLVGLIMLAVTATLVIALVLPAWAAALIVSAGLLFVAGVAGLMGKSKMANANPKPEQTIQTLKEDQEWLKHQMK